MKTGMRDTPTPSPLRMTEGRVRLTRFPQRPGPERIHSLVKTTTTECLLRATLCPAHRGRRLLLIDQGEHPRRGGGEGQQLLPGGHHGLLSALGHLRSQT